MVEITKIIQGIAVKITICSPIYYKKDRTYFFGFPVCDDISAINSENLTSNINTIKGYFLFIEEKDNRIIIANDIVGGFRLYLYKTENEIYITDDYQLILTAHAHVTFNEEEYTFYKKHRFTTGSRTFFNEIEKIPPASIICIQ